MELVEPATPSDLPEDPPCPPPEAPTGVSTDNVLLLLAENSRCQENKSSYSYQERKEAIQYQHQLREALLRKYNLLAIGE